MTDDITPETLGTLLWRLPVAIYRTDPEGRFLAANPRLLDLIGAESIDDLMDLDVRSIYVDPKQRDRMMRRVEADETIPPEEIRLRRLDGTEIWVRVSSQAVKDDDGGVRYFEGVLEDVTAKRESERRLTESNRLLDAVTAAQNRFLTGGDVGAVCDDLLDVLLSVTDSDFGFIAEVRGTGKSRFLRSMAMTNIAWNEATAEMYDRLGPRAMEFHNLETLFGRVVLDAGPVVSNDPFADPRRGGQPYGHPPIDSFLGVPVFKGHEVIAVVALANRPGGYTTADATFLEPLLTTVGSIVEAIHERQARAESEAREQVRERRFQSVVEAALDAVIVFDEAGAIEAFNPAAEQLFGYRSDEIVGDDVRRLIPMDVDVHGRWAVAGATAEGRHEVTVTHSSQDLFPAEVSLGSFQLDSHTTFTAVIRDITERKVAEDALRRAKESAERASRSKDEFLAGMSHELRTPLNGVIGLSSILLRGTHGPLRSKQTEYLTQIEKSGKHLLSLINDVLDLAKIEADSLKPDPAPVQIEALVEQALGMVREMAIAKGIALESEMEADLSPVHADERRTRQVLVNLLGNGVKFTPAGGTVGVRCSVAGNRVVVTVWDTGIGIPTDRLEDVFLPFQQVESSLDRHQEGTGLGLALSRKLIEAQGGTLTVESTEGEGSRFRFELPLDAAGSATPTPEASTHRHDGHQLSRSRVLVVEDNDINRMLITDYLDAHGLEVVVAVDGNEAVARALDSAPDVILMDIQMPRRDGLSATRELKSNPSTSHIPVIALTALAMKGDAERCMAAGCDAYLSKPCDPATVLRAVEQHLPR